MVAKNAPTEFTPDEARELSRLVLDLEARIGTGCADPAVRRGLAATQVLKLLRIRSEMAGLGMGQRSHGQRRTMTRTLNDHFGPAVTADDVLAELSRHAEVPAFVAAAVRGYFEPT